MMELSTDLSKELWDKIIFTDVIKPISCPINNTLSYIYIDLTDTHHNYIWLLPDGRLIRAYWVYSEKQSDYRSTQFIYVGVGYFHHLQGRT